jgi:hypothetical protein
MRWATRRLFSRFENLDQRHLGFLSFAGALICYDEMSTQPNKNFWTRFFPEGLGEGAVLETAAIINCI